MLPFTADVLFSSIAVYNRAIWPAPAVALALGLVALGLAMRPGRGGRRLIGAILAAAWLWAGIGFHLIHFSSINFAAPAYGLVFAVQGLALAWVCVARGRVAFSFGREIPDRAGLALAVFALALWPLVGVAIGAEPAAAPVFGVEPTATVLFTLALLLGARPPVPLWLAAVPALWTFADGATFLVLGMPEGLILPVIGTGAFALMAAKNRRSPGEGR